MRTYLGGEKMNPQLEKDLKDTMDIIFSNWKMQNNSFDKVLILYIESII